MAIPKPGSKIRVALIHIDALLHIRYIFKKMANFVVDELFCRAVIGDRMKKVDTVLQLGLENCQEHAICFPGVSLVGLLNCL